MNMNSPSLKRVPEQAPQTPSLPPSVPSEPTSATLPPPTLPPPFAPEDIPPLPAGKRGRRLRVGTLVGLCLLAGALVFAGVQYSRADDSTVALTAEKTEQQRLQKELEQVEKEESALPMSAWEVRSRLNARQYQLENEQATRARCQERISAYTAPKYQQERKELLERREALKKEIEELRKN